MHSKELEEVKETLCKCAAGDQWTKYAPHALIGAGGGALAGALLSGGQREEEDESGWDYTKRILGNALMGGALTGGAVYAGGTGYDAVAGDGPDDRVSNINRVVSKKLRSPWSAVPGGLFGAAAGGRLTTGRNDAAVGLLEAMGRSGSEIGEAKRLSPWKFLGLGGNGTNIADNLRGKLNTMGDSLEDLRRDPTTLARRAGTSKDSILHQLLNSDKGQQRFGEDSDLVKLLDAKDKLGDKVFNEHLSRAGIVDPTATGNKRLFQKATRNKLMRMFSGRGGWKGALVNAGIIGGGALLPGAIADGINGRKDK